VRSTYGRSMKARLPLSAREDGDGVEATLAQLPHHLEAILPASDRHMVEVGSTNRLDVVVADQAFDFAAGEEGAEAGGDLDGELDRTDWTTRIVPIAL